jgi:hypothetical protein
MWVAGPCHYLRGVSLSSLQTALENLDAAIAAFDPTTPESYSTPGLAVKKVTLAQLLEQRAALVAAIAAEEARTDEAGSIIHVEFGDPE